MATVVFQKGETTFGSATGFNTPTNPLVESNSSFTDSERLFTLIYPDDSTSSETFVEVGASSANTPRYNLENTKGFRIKCFDSVTSTGIQLSSGNYDSNYYYFVLIHSDNHLKHHFAKVTDIITEDVVGDAFEFTPPLGKEIPKDTEFMVFKGPIKTTKAIAFSAGIKNELKAALVVSSPLFYLLDTSLNKKGELDHNTKYHLRLQKTDGVTTTVDHLSEQRVFVTEQAFSNKILDYSKYTMQLTLTDNLKTLDVSNTSNEGNTVLNVNTDYDKIFPNARRDSDDKVVGTSTILTEGPIRYLHYDYSPTKVNVLDNVLDNKLEQSVGNRGGYCETKILNPSRMLTTKITEFDKYRVRHRVFTGDLNEFVDMKVTLGSHISSRQYNIVTDYSDVRDFINVGDEIRIGTRIIICSAITTTTITFEEYSRLETESVFTTSTSLTSLTGTLQRRAYNYQDNTILTTFNLLDGRTDELYVKTQSKDMESLESTVTTVDATHGLITLSSNSQSYSGDSSLRYSLGSYSIEVERFTGTIERINSYKEDSQNFVELNGRSNISKLFGPIINKDTAFSEDIIYSTLSPYNTLANIKAGTTHSVALGATQIDTDIKISGAQTFDNDPSVEGTRIFSENGYIGEVTGISTHGASKRRLVITPSLTKLNSEAIYMETDKNYMFNKALGSSHLTTVNPTSLTGSAGKGVYFTSGKQITMSDGSEGNDLVGSSINTNPKAIGYHINNPVSINNDNAFQAKFKDEIGSEANSSFDTVNTLIDFEIVSVSKSEGKSKITLAPYIPITLGRKIKNYGNASSYTLTEIATIQNTDLGSGVTINSTFNSIIEVSTDAIKNLDFNDAVFIGESSTSAVFAGYVSDFFFVKGEPTYGPLLIIDRDVSPTTGHKVFSVSKDSHDLFFVNGAHLWGGKILIAPHPKITSTGAVPLNLENIYSSNTDIAKKYGQPYYKLISMAKGEFNILNTKSKVFDDSKNKTYENASKLKYHSIAYKFSPKTTSDNTNEFDKTGTGDDIQTDYDMRGYGSPYGSIFAGENLRLQRTLNSNKYPNVFSGSNLTKIEEMKSDLDQKDTSAATLFFYINGDLLPYSSLRKDSLMFSNKTLTNYNLFLLENKNVIDGELEYTDTTSGKRTELRDESYQTISFQSEQDISSLKRFGLMRLTELCYDMMFNPFNPEKPTIEPSNYMRVADFDAYSFTDTSHTIHVANSTSASNNQIVLDNVGSSNPTNAEVLYDSNYRIIGTVNSYDSASKTITFTNEVILNSENTYTSGNIFKRASKIDVNIKGSKDADTFITQSRAHLQRGAMLTENYASHANDFWAQNSDNHSTVLSISGFDRIALPLRFNYSNSSDLTANPSTRQFPSRIFHDIYDVPSDYYDRCKVIVLSTYSIEAGGLVDVELGLAIPSNGQNINQFDDGNSEHTDFFMIGNGQRNFGREYPQSAANTGLVASGSSQYEAQGISLGICPRLWYDASEHDTATTITSSNGTLHSVGLKAITSKNCWLDNIDITGCYLVSENGFDTDLKASVGSGTDEFFRRLDNVIPENIIYVISHEINNSGSVRHNLTTDKALVDETAYRIMKPNETAFYDNSPKKISLNMLSGRYTKKANSDEMYSPEQDYSIKEGTNAKTSSLSGPKKEAILSMYVAIDLDKQSGSEDYIVMRKSKNFTDILPEGNHSLYMSDGENKQLTSLDVQINTDFTTEKQVIINFGSMTEMHGIVSVSEPFTVSTNSIISIDPSRACIGTTATIAHETEDLINELLEENNIEFEMTNDDYPLFLAPNYQGVDLFSAINYLLEQKDMTLFEENEVFKIKNRNDATFYKGIILNETGKYQIYDFEESKNMFNFYNKITVYGRNHKATRKRLRSINEKGLKALEVFEDKLTTQEDVNKEASKLLRLHSEQNKKIKVTIGHENISQLKVGDIIALELPRENIPLIRVIVLQIKYLLTGLMELELGRYSKGMEDIFAELLIDNKKINSKVRNQSFKESESLDFLDDMKVKGLRVLIRKKSFPTVGFPLGFSTPLNTGTSPLGLSSGSITYTTLLDEELE